ncbi:MAG: GTP 3',8-cyclase MoaA [Motiliproteus sp.]
MNHVNSRTPILQSAGTPIKDTLDRPLADLRISVMDRCNLRCPYCMPAERFNDNYQFLKRQQQLSFGEITRLARIFSRLGVNKIRLTGGEPLLRKDLTELISMLADIPGIDDIALTTNGTLLSKHAKALKQAGLNRITVSLDSINPEIFRQMSGGREDPKTVLQGIEAARDAGLSPIKVNTVVQRGVNYSSVIELLEHFRHTDVVVRFIEYMDVGTLNRWALSRTLYSSDLIESIQKHWDLEAIDPLYTGEVASRYRYRDGAGEVGFISSVSKPFCGDCSRARISSDGQLYTCLFSNQGKDIKTLLREGYSDLQLEQNIRTNWHQRQDRYSETRGTASSSASDPQRIEMFYIGG